MHATKRQVCHGKSEGGPKCEWFFSLTTGVDQPFFSFFFVSSSFFIFSMYKLDEKRKKTVKEIQRVHIDCQEVNKLRHIEQ